ncbi:MAG: hypothetical protein WCT02_02080 [Candidatus Paceibacterota bacterium]|jgi:hypothetical protein
MFEMPSNAFEDPASEQEEAYEAYLAENPITEIRPEDRKDCAEKVAALEGLIGRFEGEFDLKKLLAIDKLTPEEAPRHPLREPARKALNPIFEHLKFLENETNISRDQLESLKSHCHRLSQAVGIINNNRVDHKR